MNDFKGRHHRGEIILWAVRWYCKYGISYRDLETMLAERGESRPQDFGQADKWMTASFWSCNMGRRRNVVSRDVLGIVVDRPRGRYGRHVPYRAKASE